MRFGSWNSYRGSIHFLIAGWLALHGCFASTLLVADEPLNAFPLPALPADDASVERISSRGSDSNGLSQGQSCVLLKNDNVLVGEVTKLGNLVEVTRDDASKIRIPSNQVTTIADSLHQLYVFRQQNRFDSDVEAIQKDIRWCLRNGMIREAARDALHVKNIDPQNSETSRLLGQIASRLRGRQQSHRPGTSIRPVSHEAPLTMPDRDNEVRHPDPEDIGLTDESIYQFQARVQPILLNRCSSCHTKHPSNDRPFQFYSSSRVKWAPSATARENLVEVLKYVDFANPSESMIRSRASDAHAGTRHSFGKPGSTMMNNLDQWLRALPATTTLAPSKVPNLAPVDPTETAGRSPDPNEKPPERVRRMPKVENPFDPSIFNRRFHPE